MKITQENKRIIVALEFVDIFPGGFDSEFYGEGNSKLESLLIALGKVVTLEKELAKAREMLIDKVNVET